MHKHLSNSKSTNMTTKTKPRVKYVKICLKCGSEFIGRKHSKYCSFSCWKQPRKPKACLRCGKIFIGRLPTSKFCSRACACKPKKPIKIWICIQCQKSFVNRSHKPTRQFCSRRCADQYRWAHEPPKPIRPSDVMPRSKMLKCERCGFNKYPEILKRHHKDHNHANSDPNNIEVVCPNCHDIEHLLAKDGTFTYLNFQTSDNPGIDQAACSTGYLSPYPNRILQLPIEPVQQAPCQNTLKLATQSCPQDP